MAAISVHEAIYNGIKEQIPLQNPERFRLGNLLPDAYQGNKNRDITHYKTVSAGLKFYNFLWYFKQYQELIYGDDLYLGYYTHLLTDAVERDIMYNIWKLDQYKRDENFLENKYHDFDVLNPYLIETYGLKPELQLPDDLGDQPINAIYPFDPVVVLKWLNKTFASNPENKELFYLKFELIDELITNCTGFCVDEIKNILYKGEPKADCLKYVWK